VGWGGSGVGRGGTGDGAGSGLGSGAGSGTGGIGSGIGGVVMAYLLPSAAGSNPWRLLAGTGLGCDSHRSHRWRCGTRRPGRVPGARPARHPHREEPATWSPTPPRSCPAWREPRPRAAAEAVNRTTSAVSAARSFLDDLRAIARQGHAALLTAAAAAGTPAAVIHHGGQVVAVVVPIGEYQQLRQAMLEQTGCSAWPLATHS